MRYLFLLLVVGLQALGPASLARSRRLESDWMGTILPHPAGCAWRDYCGCGVSVDVFGRDIPFLRLAANWLTFPRATPGPGMVAVWPHHVARIRQIRSRFEALLYDPNSGRHLTRLHWASLAGAVIVNPRGYNSRVGRYDLPIPALIHPYGRLWAIRGYRRGGGT